MISVALEVQQERLHSDPQVVTLLSKLDESEFRQIGLLVVTSALMTRPRGVLIQASATREAWVVTVRPPQGGEFVARSTSTLSGALHSALEWLRKPLREEIKD